MSALQDILKNIQPKLIFSVIEDDEFPPTPEEILILQRSTSFQCLYCKKRFSDAIPPSVQGCPRVCFCCERDIVSKSEHFKTILYQKYKIVYSVLPSIHSDILEYGFYPNRVQQTQHYNYNWFN